MGYGAIKRKLICSLAFLMLLTSCSSLSAKNSGDSIKEGNGNQKSVIANEKESQEKNAGKTDGQSANSGSTVPGAQSKEPSVEELKEIKANELGKIFVVMFHNFTEVFTPTKYDNGEYTTTFSSFEKSLEDLYARGYRLISMEDFINGNIRVPSGKIPMVFTFDDATPGQFHFIEKDGKLEVDPKTAVGILEEFNKKHPDFGTKGVFYLNMDDNQFEGKGTMEQRLKYLLEKGYELGNHTATHISLSSTSDPEKLKKEIGGNQKKLSQILPDYKFKTLSLPFGIHPVKGLEQYVIKGTYEGVAYENFALMEVGSGWTVSPFHKKRNLMAVTRVRASGMKPVNMDLEWWLKSLGSSEQFISDGNPDTVAVPKTKEGDINQQMLKGKKLITY